MVDVSNLTDFAKGYIAAALWCGVEYPDGHPNSNSDKDDSVNVLDIEPDLMQRMITDCEDFCMEAQTLLQEACDKVGYSEEMAGHDFWLTRNGHGAGFWDRNELGKDLGDKLTKIAKQYGEIDLFRTDAGAVDSM